MSNNSLQPVLEPDKILTSLESGDARPVDFGTDHLTVVPWEVK